MPVDAGGRRREAVPDRPVAAAMTVWLVKLVHIAAISIWAAGLLALPFVLMQRTGLAGRDLARFHRMVHFLHVVVMSPAAYIAVGSGIALIFLRETFVGWFSAKLLFVGLLVGMHVLAGRAALAVFDGEYRIGPLIGFSLTAGSLGAVLSILALVLVKPELGVEGLGDLFRPGELRRLAAEHLPFELP
jgi:protoporphyrinogen IX oxidase